MQSPGWDPGGVEGLSQASTDPVQGESPAAPSPLTARSCQRPVTFLSMWSILGFLGREWQLMEEVVAKSQRAQRGGGPLDDSGRTGEAGERDPHVNHKGSRGAPCLGPCSAVPFGAPRAYVMSLRGPSLWAESHTPVLPRAAYPKGPLIRTYLFSPACSPPSTRSHTHIWMLTCTCRHAHSHTCTHSYSHSYIHTCTHSRYTHIRPEHSSMRTRSVSRNRKGNKRTQEKKRKSRDRKSQDSPGNNRQAGKGGRQRENVEGITQLRVFLL